MKQELQIILADDDKDDHFLFLKTIDSLSYATSIISILNGEKLMQYLCHNLENLPDVIFLDLNMPGKSGAQCLMEIKGQARLKNIPVIIYSTAFHDDLLKQLYKHGADLCVRKRADMTELRTVLHHIVKSLAEGVPVSRMNDGFAIHTIVA